MKHYRESSGKSRAVIFMRFKVLLTLDILNARSRIIVRNHNHHHVFDVRKNRRKNEGFTPEDFPVQSSSDIEETELRSHNKVLQHYKTFSGETKVYSCIKLTEPSRSFYFRKKSNRKSQMVT